MRLDITVSLQHYLDRRLDFMLVWDHPGATTFELAALEHPLVRVQGLTAEAAGQSISLPLAGHSFTVAAATPITLRYSVSTPFTDCMGSDRQVDLILPFSNAYEVFFGTGVIPYPADLPRMADELQVSFRLTDLPDGWQAFSSLITGGAHPAKLDGFFCYCCPPRPPEISVYAGSEKRVTFRWLTQHGKTFADLPFLIDSARRWLDWLEANLAPYSGLEQIDVLLLRAPHDYLAQTGGNAFATGENVLNGIVAYGPDAPAELAKLGYPTYRAFLVSGLLHEILHFYTTAAWNGQYKSILYPAPDCPRPDSRIMGEALNLYFSEQFALTLLGAPPDAFAALLERRVQPNRRDSLVDLAALDRDLQARGTSLRALFAALLERKRRVRTPYGSIDWMFDVLREAFGIDRPTFF